MTLADRVVVMKQGVVQQVGTPTDIYDNPANTFVAGFIGSPAMNLLKGTMKDGCFSGDNVEISSFSAADGPITLGFRAEDAAVSPSVGSINATVYTMELLGDATMIAVKAGGALVSVKANKDYRAKIGDQVSISVPQEICHLFDPSTGARIRA
jgi:multiple sugar transport system ATP-binding protein